MMNKVYILAALTLLICICGVLADGGSDVIVLTAKTFDTQLDAGGDWFIEFYAPWCGHCKNLVPIWEELASTTKDFKVAKVNCQDEQDIGNRFSIRGFPTLKFFHEGKFYDYRGDRKVEAFIEFTKNGYKTAQSSAYPDGRPLLNDTVVEEPAHEDAEEPAHEEAEEIIKTDIIAGVVDLNASNFDEILEGVWFIKFFAPWCGHCRKLAPTWDELGNKEQKTFNVAKVDCDTNKELCKKHGVRGYPTLKLFINGNHKADYSGARQIDNFISFVEAQTATAQPLKEEL